MSEAKDATIEQKNAWIETFLGVDLAQLRAKALAPPPPPLRAVRDLAGLSRPTPATSAQALTPLGKAGGNGAAVALAKCVLLWDRTRKDLADQIGALQREICERAVGESDFEAIKAACRSSRKCWNSSTHASQPS